MCIRDRDFTFAASYLWVMAGSRRPEQVTRPLKSLERRGIEVVIGDVTDIDPTSRTLTVGERTLTGDHLVVSLGADWATDRVPCLLYTSPSPRDRTRSRMPSSA